MATKGTTGTLIYIAAASSSPEVWSSITFQRDCSDTLTLFARLIPGALASVGTRRWEDVLMVMEVLPRVDELRPFRIGTRHRKERWLR